uniref:Uncharacterized protein n=1 Tax=Globodera rostochiensis TaxID=31243 RepID=A0A914HHH3_GLORO
MERYLMEHKSEGIDCGQVKVVGFRSHPRCYLKCGFCEVCKTNKWALLGGYRLSDFLSLEALRQVVAVMRKCGVFNCLLGNTQ